MPEGLITEATEAPVPEEAGLATQAAAPEQVTEEGEPATPEEQEAYDAAINMASELVHVNDESSEQIMSMLEEGEDPVPAVVNVVEFIMQKIEEAFQGNLPETVIIPAADEITDMVMDLGEEAGAFDLADDQIMLIKGSVVKSLLEQYQDGIEESDITELLQGVNPEEVNAFAPIFGG